MTTEEIIELSKQVAEVLGIPPASFKYRSDDLMWLAEDAGRCAVIAADKKLNTSYMNLYVLASWWDSETKMMMHEHALYADHNNERIKAYCVAVCKAVIEQAKP